MKIKVSRSKQEILKNSGTVKLQNITCGKAIALLNAITERAVFSSVANDIKEFLLKEIKENWSGVL